MLKRVPPTLALIALLAGTSAAVPTPSPAPQGSPLPEIYHSISRPLCSALTTKVRPAIGMMLQNDRTIAKSPPLFQDYIRQSTIGSDAGKDMAVNRMESLITPLVQNTLAVQKLLEDSSVFPDHAPQTDDDRALIALKQQMLKTLAAQQASLDIINGFITTQQLGEMQHEGMAWLSSITGNSNQPTNSSNAPGSAAQALNGTGNTNNSLAPQGFDNLVLNAGLTPNSYEIDPTRIPGLAVGYNQIGKLKDGVVWTQDEAKRQENPLARQVIAASQACGAQLPAAPAPSPSAKP